MIIHNNDIHNNDIHNNDIHNNDIHTNINIDDKSCVINNR